MSSCRERSVTNPIAADGVATGTAAAPSPTFTVASVRYSRRLTQDAGVLIYLI